MKYSECTYWHRCKQIKNPICISSYETCPIYKEMKTIDPKEGYFIGAIHLEDIIKISKKSIDVRPKD